MTGAGGGDIIIPARRLPTGMGGCSKLDFTSGKRRSLTGGRLFLYVSKNTKDDHTDEFKKCEHFEYRHGDHLHSEEQPAACWQTTVYHRK